VADGATVDQLRLGDHVCWTFDDDRERSEAMAGYVRAGLQQKQKIMYVTDSLPTSTLLGELEARGVAVEAGLHSGQLTVSTSNETYLAGGRFDPAAMLRRWGRELAQASREGYTGVRAVGDMSWGQRPVPGTEHLSSYEAELNRVFSDGFGMGVCLYDRRLFSDRDLNRVASAHPGTVGPRASRDWLPLLRLVRTSEPAGVRLIGEADLSNRDALQTMLRQLMSETATQVAPVVVDLTEVTFVDSSAARALVRAETRSEGRLRLAGALPHLARLLQLHRVYDDSQRRSSE
jgi:anti-anti-sigma factor